MDTAELIEMRQRWLAAAFIYYLQPGDDTDMSDYTWDHYGRVLFENRAKLPGCPILNAEGYEGGSLFWVKRELYAAAQALSEEELTHG